MGYPSTYEKIEERRHDALHLRGCELPKYKGPRSLTTFFKATQVSSGLSARDSTSSSAKRMEERRQRRIEREKSQQAWREQMNLILIEEDNVILDFGTGAARPIKPGSPVAPQWSGSDREWKPDPRDTTEPWTKLAPGNRLIFENDQWAVTTGGLEPLYSSQPERYERYVICADSLLQMHHRGRVYFWPVDVAARPWFDFDVFEEAFKKALETHRRKHKVVVDDQILETTFRRARAIARRTARSRRTANPDKRCYSHEAAHVLRTTDGYRTG